MTLPGWFKLVICLLLAIGLIWGGMFLKGGSTADVPASSDLSRKIKEYTVQRQTFRVVFTESGKLRAIKSWPVSVNIMNTQLSIAWLATEGVSVKKGDKIAEFVTKEFNDHLTEFTKELEKQKQQLQVSRSALDIAISTGKSNVAAATTKLAEAKVALSTYRDLEGPKKLNELDTSINESRAKQATAQKAVTESQRQIDDQIFTEDDQRKQLEGELSDAKETLETSKRILKAFTLQKKIFRQYEYPQQFESKKQAVDNADLELAKAKVSATQEVNQKQIEVSGVEAQIELLQRQVGEQNENIKKCTVLAPADGLVIYGSDSNDRYYGRSEEIRVGSQWYGGNTLMTIPDLSAFEIDINIPEDFRGRIKEELPINATLEAIPGLTVRGKLKSISKLGKANGFDYTGQGPRVFESVVSLDSNDLRMVSGMSVKVDIVADTATDVLAVPIESVFNEDGLSVCYVRSHGEIVKRVVTTGRRNTNLVEIVDGLVESETVSLVEPLQSGRSTRSVGK